MLTLPTTVLLPETWVVFKDKVSFRETSYTECNLAVYINLPILGVPFTKKTMDQAWLAKNNPTNKQKNNQVTC